MSVTSLPYFQCALLFVLLQLYSIVTVTGTSIVIDTVTVRPAVILTTIRDVCTCVFTIGRKSLRAFVIPLQSSHKFVYH